MKRILVATDFSTRSDRALRRACILARQLPARLALAHAVDPDRPQTLVEGERRAAATLLDAVRRTLAEFDGLDCEVLLTQGDAFVGVIEAADRTIADLIVLGAHRRELLRDAFAGTTAERTIRASHRPVLMCNALPAAPYRRIVVAVDCSEVSAHAIRSVDALGLGREAAISALHVFDVPAAPLLTSAVAVAESVAEARAQAERALDRFFSAQALSPLAADLLVNDGSAGEMLLAGAHRQGADLLVLGTHGRAGLRRQVLGSVAEAVLRAADLDVLVVPPTGAAV